MFGSYQQRAKKEVWLAGWSLRFGAIPKGGHSLSLRGASGNACFRVLSTGGTGVGLMTPWPVPRLQQVSTACKQRLFGLVLTDKGQELEQAAVASRQCNQESRSLG